MLSPTGDALHYKKTGNLRAVQLLLGHTKMDSTVRYLGVDLEDACRSRRGSTCKTTAPTGMLGAGPPKPNNRLDRPDPVFRARYIALLEENSKNVLSADALTGRIRDHAAVIAPTALRDQSRDGYEAAVTNLVQYVRRSEADLQAFLQAHL